MQKLCSKTEIKAPEMASGTSGILLKLEEYLEASKINTYPISGNKVFISIQLNQITKLIN